MGYHLTHIPRGQYGEASKIIEECMEFEDALDQNCKLMALVELSDLVGAIKGYLHFNHPTLSLKDLEDMAFVTKRAFESGDRE